MSGILTEEELNKISYPSITIARDLEKLKASHRAQSERIKMLVLENDELNAENYILKEGESP